jgi:hypothetical protein
MYEEKSVTKKYVENDMNCQFFINHPKPLGLPKFFKIKEILKIIDKNIDIEYNKYNDFGSIREYSSFTRNRLILAIIKEIEKKKRELAIEFIQNKSNILVWMNSVLYKPPDEAGENEGVRYIDVKKSFEDQAKITN